MFSCSRRQTYSVLTMNVTDTSPSGNRIMPTVLLTWSPFVSLPDIPLRRQDGAKIGLQPATAKNKHVMK